MSTNHNTFRRGEARGGRVDGGRVIAFAPDAEVAAWIEQELRGEDLMLQVSRSIQDVVAALLEDPPPRPQILVVDFDALGGVEVFDLHHVRDGWFGVIVGLGSVGDALSDSLHVERAIGRPLAADSLRKAVRAAGLARPTMKLSRVRAAF